MNDLIILTEIMLDLIQKTEYIFKFVCSFSFKTKIWFRYIKYDKNLN